MLPKLSKNLFQAKAKLATKKAFNFKAFLITAFFAGTTAIAGTQLPAHISINDLIKKQNEVEYLSYKFYTCLFNFHCLN